MTESSAPHSAAPLAVLVNPYELGRQSFALAHPAALLKREGFAVTCVDLSLQKLTPATLAGARLIAIHVGMHTATRIAAEAIPRIRQLEPRSHLCVYGLYAPMNAAYLKSLGVRSVLGGEFEPALVSLARRLKINGQDSRQSEPVVHLGRVDFTTPDRGLLPDLGRYAHLELPNGATRMVGFVEASRGCKHVCRHCPVVPVYQGRFRAVPREVVLADVRQQVARGAQHISYGDPDFLNGPTHALKIVRAVHEEFPELTYDATIKIQHVIEQCALLPELKRTGCLFITSAAESVDDRILRLLDKNHTGDDFKLAVWLLRAAGIALAPTFVPFTPWSTLRGYVDLLQRLVDLGLIESVPPIQLCIRLLVPEGSYLLRIPGFADLLEAFDPEMLGYPWKHPDSRVDALQTELQHWVTEADRIKLARREVFARIWRLAHEALGRRAPPLPQHGLGEAIPHLSEPWYCCAEPTAQQLASF